MKVIKQQIQTKKDTVRVIPIGDVHLGDKQLDRQLLMATIDKVKKGKDTYCILMGDLLNNAIKSSISDTYNETLTPMDALTEIVKLFGPIQDRILAVIPGNHENRTWKTDGLDLNRLMCMQFGIEDLYSDTTALLWLQLHKEGLPNRITYSIYVTHGSGGGRKAGGKINRLIDYGTIVDADVFICAHTHSPAVVRQGYFRVDRTRGVATEVDRLFVNSAAFLTYGGYGDAQGYTPASRKNPEILLSTDYHNRKAEAII